MVLWDFLGGGGTGGGERCDRDPETLPLIFDCNFATAIPDLPRQRKAVLFAPCKGIRIQESRKFCMWNPETRALKSRIQLKESGSPLSKGI